MIWSISFNQTNETDQTDQTTIFLCRLDEAVGRQLRASQVVGEQRLNLAAKFVLNLIRRFSGIDHFEVKLFRHFVELLYQK